MALCHKPPAQNLISLRPSNFVCACCPKAGWCCKTKVKDTKIKLLYKPGLGVFTGAQLPGKLSARRRPGLGLPLCCTII